MRIKAVSFKEALFAVFLLIVMVCLIIVTMGYVISYAINVGTKPTAKLAIVIDDFGLDRHGIEKIMTYDEKITFAVMPMLEYSEADVINAVRAGHEVIIHIPLQSQYNDNPKWVGPYVIKVGFTDEQIRQRISEFCDSIPEARGANIHMGALGSTDNRVMTNIIAELKKRDMFFVDSKTSVDSVCENVAKDVGIKFYSNNIFLENYGSDKATVKKRLQKAAEIALKEGECMAIGHVGGEGGENTADAIFEMTEQIKRMGVELVYVSDLIK